jgi:hypothetical protein
MLNKSLLTLKKNPIIIILYLFVTGILVLSFFLISPDLNKLTTISNEINQNSANPSSIDPKIMVDMLSAALKLLMYGLILCIFGILFISGFGSLFAEAVAETKTSLKSFFIGIKKNFVKTLLSFLLFMAFSFGFGIIIAIVLIIFSVSSMVNSNFDTQSIYNTQRIIQALASIIMIFAYPLVELWFPSIYMDKNDGVIMSLKKGFKTGIKNYKLLIVVTAVLMLPSIGLVVFNNNINAMVSSPAYIVMYIYQVIAGPVVLMYLFTLYKDSRQYQHKIE